VGGSKIVPHCGQKGQVLLISTGMYNWFGRLSSHHQTHIRSEERAKRKMVGSDQGRDDDKTNFRDVGRGLDAHSTDVRTKLCGCHALSSNVYVCRYVARDASNKNVRFANSSTLTYAHFDSYHLRAKCRILYRNERFSSSNQHPICKLRIYKQFCDAIILR
jgi:hypothetical protein